MGLKEELLRLLKEDVEFRYAVLGYLGLDEVIKAIHALQEQVAEHTKAIRALQEQVKALQEQVAEHSKTIAEHSRVLRELVEAVKGLDERVTRLEGKVNGLTAALMDVRKALGVTLEEFARSFLRGLLEARGVSKEKLKLQSKTLRIDGEEVQINIFNEDPLIIGEVTSLAESPEEAEKVAKRIRVVEKAYGRRPQYAFLIAQTIARRAYKGIMEVAEKEGIEVIYGRIA